MSEGTIARQEQNHKDGKAKKSKKRKRDPAGELEQTSGKDLKEESAAAKADRKKTKKQKRDLNTMDVQEAALALKESHPAKADKREEDRKSKKQRKAKRDVEKGLGRKRLAEEEGKEGVSAGTGTEAYVPPHATTDEVQDAVAEKSKTKKRKGAETNPSQETTGEVEQVRETQESIDHVQSAADDPEANGKDNKEKTIENVETGTASRFIVFIGNLPFTATTEKIAEHFKSIKPTSIRHMTDKGTSKSKGYAFLEFDNYDRMKSCLKLYHHSKFDAGKKPARKINVELTAGGGGKNYNRMEKLRVKNERLAEQRRRKAEVAAKQRERREAKKAAQDTEGAEKEGVAEEKEDQFDMHPSRRAQLQGY